MINVNNKKILRIAHRGASGYAPENTIEAFSKALELGVDIIEFDVHLTKDERIIVMHDHNIKRTTDGIGIIRNLTLKDIRKFYKPNGEHVPLLQDVLEFLKSKAIAKIEIKDKKMEDDVIKIVNKNNAEQTTIITSKIPSVIENVKKLAPKIKTEIIFESRLIIENMISKARVSGVNIIAPHYSMVNKELVEEAHRNGFDVHVWTVNDNSDIEAMKKIGVDGITSDFPDRI